MKATEKSMSITMEADGRIQSSLKAIASMMRAVSVILFLLFICSSVYAKDIQLFNPEIFGQETSSSIKVLMEKKSDEIEPITVMVDIKSGKYYAATVTYPMTIATFDATRENLNKVYGKYEVQSAFQESKTASWRIEDKKFSISLQAEACNASTESEGCIRIIYIQFQPMRDVFKNILRSKGVNTEGGTGKESEQK